MGITLQDVADAAGVSRSTASRALAGSTLISPETRAAVTATAGQLGYRVNRVASALRSRQTRLIGLVLNNLINASFHTIAEVVQHRAYDKGYQVILMISGADPKREHQLLSTLADHHVDGLIVIGTGQNVGQLNRMITDGTPIVTAIRGPAGSFAPAVLAADRDGAHEATRHLIGLTHRRIAFIGGPERTNSGAERYAGYVSALGEAGIDVDPALVARGQFDPGFGSRAAAQLLDTDATALFVANHEAVFGALPAIVARGVRVPEELSLVCYEDIPWLRTWAPPITVVDNGPRQLADLAMDLLLGQLERPAPAAAANGAARNYRVGAALIERRSTAPPHR